MTERLEVNVTRNRETGEYRVLLNLTLEQAEALQAVLKHQPTDGTFPLTVALGEVLEEFEWTN